MRGLRGIDGTPRVVPVSFLWTDRRIVVGTIPTSGKVRALYDRTARITIEPTWARLDDVETTLPRDVERIDAGKGFLG